MGMRVAAARSLRATVGCDVGERGGTSTSGTPSSSPPASCIGRPCDTGPWERGLPALLPCAIMSETVESVLVSPGAVAPDAGSGASCMGMRVAAARSLRATVGCDVGERGGTWWAASSARRECAPSENGAVPTRGIRCTCTGRSCDSSWAKRHPAPYVQSPVLEKAKHNSVFRKSGLRISSLRPCANGHAVPSLHHPWAWNLHSRVFANRSPD